ncbi:MAG: thioredoxin [Actinomycetes bacterium]|jgi:thioredoxin 1
MATIALNEANFESTIQGEGLTLIDFWADWCGPCKMFAPIYDKVSEENPGVTFAKVDTEAEQNVAAMCGIQSIPTIMVFRDGILLFNQAGALPEHSLKEIVAAAQALDMDEVRREIENEQQNG